jgi:cytochrome P450
VQLQKALSGEVTWLQVFEEYARWMSPIGMSPRRIAKAYTLNDITFEPEDRAFLMFGSGNRDELIFANPDVFDVTRDTTKAISFGAGPHFCAGAWASRCMIAEVALPMFFERFKNVTLTETVAYRGWAFRGPLSVKARGLVQ